jgi:hypothetical protein
MGTTSLAKVGLPALCAASRGDGVSVTISAAAPSIGNPSVTHAFQTVFVRFIDLAPFRQEPVRSQCSWKCGPDGLNIDAALGGALLVASVAVRPSIGGAAHELAAVCERTFWVVAGVLTATGGSWSLDIT